MDKTELFSNGDLPIKDRVEELLGGLTLEEKIGQLRHDAPAIERLGIPAYNWLNECLHGVARAGVATVFPQALGLAASWDVETVGLVGSAIGDEARAKHHEFIRHGDRGMYKGLTFFSPNINIFRDPRWGRGHETYGECPHLTGRMAVAYICGLQGGDPRYLKVAATAKHFAVHSGPESQRSTYDARPTEKDLRETYLPAFEASVREARVESIMGAYNRLDGEPCCANRRLLVDILRGEWGFDGAVMGPNADNREILIGNYNGVPSRHVTPLEGIRAALTKGTRLIYAPGCDLTDKPGFFAFGPKDRALTEAVMAAGHAGVAILCLGISPRVEGENGDPEAGETDAGGDRMRLEIPGCQLELLKAVKAAGAKVVVLYFGGSPTVCPWAQDHADAILQVWYPGAEGGLAIGDILFGEESPSARLPITIPKATGDLPPLADYRMKGRTYRYAKIEPLYPFGFGLGYSRFEYAKPCLSQTEIDAGAKVVLSVSVKNVGHREAEEVVQLYLRHPESSIAPLHSLQGFTRRRLAPGETAQVEFVLEPSAMAVVDEQGHRQIEPGWLDFYVGGSQPDARSLALGAAPWVQTRIKVRGSLTVH